MVDYFSTKQLHATASAHFAKHNKAVLTMDEKTSFEGNAHAADMQSDGDGPLNKQPTGLMPDYPKKQGKMFRLDLG